jgi:hypothetical protein
MDMTLSTNFLRSAALLLTSLAILSGCGGGGDGSVDSITASTTGLSVTVSDSYGAKVAGVTVEATVGDFTVTATTGAKDDPNTGEKLGVALLVFRGTPGTASGTISHPTFVSKTFEETLTANQLREIEVTLDRATSAAGGALTSRSGTPPSVAPGAQSMTFEIELVVVDGNSQPITNLTAANFVLRSCTPDPANDRVDCVRGDASFDAAYVPVTGAPEAVALIPGAAAEAYAAALMLDQSGSIYTSDPTGARLYSAKAFLKSLGAEDSVLLSAFANGAAMIPDIPLTVYPPFRDSVDAPSYFSTLDSLATLVGGNTPLYAALDLMPQQFASDTSLPAGIAKSVVIFTDGDDTDCGTAVQCRERRDLSITAANAAGLRVFTIGLSSGVNFETLGELANKTGGAFLFAESAEQLIPLYGSVGKLLSLSLPTYRLRWTLQTGTPDAFLPGHALLGRVEVNARTSTFDVPFIVGIP